MRTIVNISLPKEMLDAVKQEVKKEGYASTSEFMRSLVRKHMRAKLAAELHKQTKAFEKAMASGSLKGSGWKELKSLKDLR